MVCVQVERSERSEWSVLTAWGPGAGSRAPGGVQGQRPGGGPGGRAPGSSWVFRVFQTPKRLSSHSFSFILKTSFSAKSFDILRYKIVCYISMHRPRNSNLSNLCGRCKSLAPEIVSWFLDSASRNLLRLRRKARCARLSPPADSRAFGARARASRSIFLAPPALVFGSIA